MVVSDIQNPNPRRLSAQSTIWRLSCLLSPGLAGREQYPERAQPQSKVESWGAGSIRIFQPSLSIRFSFIAVSYGRARQTDTLSSSLRLSSLETIG
ncbi:hypothetical protein NXS19_009197 [Fusarium pseudograminearum]|nr:hypothetical protein NXS19_009197 [Fusarium pseudograminearum]